MPIFSYLAIPKNGAKDQLCSDLAALPGCEIIPADNQDIVILVTDTPDEETEDNLQAALKAIESLQTLSLTFGCDDQDQQGN